MNGEHSNAREAPTTDRQLPWTHVSDGLPDFNRLVLARMEGSFDHSGLCWHREGYAFMVRHNEEEFVVGDKWSVNHHAEALAKMGADKANVTHWFYVVKP